MVWFPLTISLFVYFGGGAQAGRKYQRIDRLYESVFPQKLGGLRQWLVSAFEIGKRYQEEHMSCGTNDVI